VLELQEVETASQVELLREEFRAKMNMQEDNFKEQKLVQVIRTSEEQMRDVQNLVHAIQMMVEMDQYATQHVFDQVRTVTQIA